MMNSIKRYNIVFMLRWYWWKFKEIYRNGVIFLIKKSESVDLVDSHEVCTIDAYDPELHISLKN